MTAASDDRRHLVHFVGAGPGDPELVTLKAVRLLNGCDLCLYAGSLVPAEILTHLPTGAERIDTARMELPEIVATLVSAARAGRSVVRLHSGDISLYSAVAEQIRALEQEGVGYDVTPGVPAFAAAAATLGRELTVPGVGQSLLITRVSTLSTDMPPGEDLATLAATGVTLALHLAAHRGADIVAALTPHYGADCPTATVAFASRPHEQVVRAPLADLANALREADIRRTAVIFVGRALAATHYPDSYLYSRARSDYLACHPDSHQ